MNAIHIAGQIDDLFSHMTLLGLGSILEDAGVPDIRVHWDSEERPVLGSSEELAGTGIATIVIGHARRHAEPGSWLHDRFEISDGKKTVDISAAGPRTKAPSTLEEWHELEYARRASLDNATTMIDRRFIQGMGYRSWWYNRNKDLRPDVGANAWEMRTRNRGMEFVKDRLLPLAQIVADWSPEKVWNGLDGHEVDDVHGKNALDSRTSTGFSTPHPVDNARAWCALWGLTTVPVAVLRDPSRSYPAYLPPGAVEGTRLRQLLVAVPDRPLSMARIRALARSAQLVAAADSNVENAVLRQDAAWEWLQQHGTGAVLRFPIQVVGSTSAPERQALTGIRVRP